MLNKRFEIKHGSSAQYWENRYKHNGTSGAGSYGEPANYKASIINQFVKDNNIHTVVELGCGDGNQLSLFDFPSYTGYDVSATAIKKCQTIFQNDHTKQFFLYDTGQWKHNPADLSLSLDVIYHLLEEDVYESYLHNLFVASKKYVIIYSWEREDAQLQHIKYRKFNKWIEENIRGWQLQKVIKNEEPIEACDFFIYQRTPV